MAPDEANRLVPFAQGFSRPLRTGAEAREW